MHMIFNKYSHDKITIKNIIDTGIFFFNLFKYIEIVEFSSITLFYKYFLYKTP